MIHVGAIEETFDAEDYQAMCSCEWYGPLRDSRAQAETDLQKHYDEVSL
jgi:hypothetical protein